MKRGQYTSNDELAALIGGFNRDRRAMPADRLARLVEVLQLIAGGVWDRWQYTQAKDDYVQDCLFLFLHRALPKIDPTKNPFSYLTTVAKNHGLKMRRDEIRHRTQDDRHGWEVYAAHLTRAEAEAEALEEVSLVD